MFYKHLPSYVHIISYDNSSSANGIMTDEVITGKDSHDVFLFNVNFGATLATLVSSIFM